MPVSIDTVPDETRELFARARGGDQAAWDQLFKLCFPKLRRTVSRRLKNNRTLQSLYDSTDFASDVMKSLAANAGRLDFESFGDLVAFLKDVVNKKYVDEHRKATAMKRDVFRVRPLSHPWHGGGRAMSLASNDPTASQVALANEAEEALAAGLSGPEQREALELKKRGDENSDIALKLGWHPRKVQRFFKWLHERYERPGGR